MALPPDERRDRAKVNEAVREGLRLGPLRPAGSEDPVQRSLRALTVPVSLSLNSLSVQYCTDICAGKFYNYHIELHTFRLCFFYA
jgi:hypothetical protein